MTEWKTIDSAPNDGTWVMAVYEGIDHRTGRPWVPMIVRRRNDSAWFDDITDWDDWDPTHWMPLPDPPPKT